MNRSPGVGNTAEASKVVLRGMQYFVDLLTLSAAYWVAFALRFEFNFTFDTYKLLLFTWPYVIVLKFVLLFVAPVGAPADPDGRPQPRACCVRGG